MGALLSLALHFHSSWEFFMNKLLWLLCNKHVFAKMSFKVSLFSLMVSLEHSSVEDSPLVWLLARPSH